MDQLIQSKINCIAEKIQYDNARSNQFLIKVQQEKDENLKKNSAIELAKQEMAKFSKNILRRKQDYELSEVEKKIRQEYYARHQSQMQKYDIQKERLQF